MPLALSLESSFVILQISGKAFRLEGPQGDWELGGESADSNGGGARRYRRRVRWSYRSSYEEALDLGSLNDATAVIQEVAAFLPATAQSGQLLTQWNEARDRVAQVPVLSNLVDTVTSTSVRITDVGLNLDLVTQMAPNSNQPTAITGDGDFTLGLAFTPSPAKPVRLLRFNLQAFGLVLKVKMTGLSFNNGLLQPGP
jgi:hypothetical protein